MPTAVWIGYLLVTIIAFRRLMYHFFDDVIERGRPWYSDNEWGLGLFIAIVAAIFWPLVLLGLGVEKLQNNIASVPRSVKKRVKEQNAAEAKRELEEENRRKERELELVIQTPDTSQADPDGYIASHSARMEKRQEARDARDAANKKLIQDADNDFRDRKATALLEGKDIRSIEYRPPNYDKFL